VDLPNTLAHRQRATDYLHAIIAKFRQHLAFVKERFINLNKDLEQIQRAMAAAMAENSDSSDLDRQMVVIITEVYFEIEQLQSLMAKIVKARRVLMCLQQGSLVETFLNENIGRLPLPEVQIQVREHGLTKNEKRFLREYVIAANNPLGSPEFNYYKAYLQNLRTFNSNVFNNSSNIAANPALEEDKDLQFQIKFVESSSSSSNSSIAADLNPEHPKSRFQHVLPGAKECNEKNDQKSNLLPHVAFGKRECNEKKTLLLKNEQQFDQIIKAKEFRRNEKKNHKPNSLPHVAFERECNEKKPLLLKNEQQCDQKIKAKELLLTKEKDLKVRGFQCTHCNKTLTTKFSLKLHIKSIHLKLKDFKCPICDIEFVVRSKLKVHMETVHGGLKKFKCAICGKAFPHKISLRRHLRSNRTHTTEVQAAIKNTRAAITRYICKICYNDFGQEEHLINHFKIATNCKQLL
jgi:hypothetical protein